MVQFVALLKLNLNRRVKDGFAIGYNIIFPLVIIGLLGFICRGADFGPINAFAYLSVVITPFTTFMSVVTAAYAGKDDAYSKAAERVISSPVSFSTIVITKVIAETVVFMGCSIIVLAISQIFWNHRYINYIIPVCLLYLSMSLLTAGIGTWIGLGMKNFLVVKNFISVPVCIMAVAGGCFFRIGSSNSGLELLVRLSPFTWINRSIFEGLYDDRSIPMYIAAFVMAAAGLIFTVIAVKTFKKEEYKNGELPSYEK